jgi:quinol monooxygenase YgiN
MIDKGSAPGNQYAPRGCASGAVGEDIGSRPPRERLATMTTVLCLCRVGDFDAWRPQFERDVAAQTGVQSYRIWRSQDDPNLVAVIETRESRDAAEAVWSTPQLGRRWNGMGGFVVGSDPILRRGRG